MFEPQQIQVLSLKSLVSFFNQCSSALSMISKRTKLVMSIGRNHEEGGS